MTSGAWEKLYDVDTPAGRLPAVVEHLMVDAMECTRKAVTDPSNGIPESLHAIAIEKATPVIRAHIEKTVREGWLALQVQAGRFQ